ncbi:glucose/galactose MFS transporter [Bacteroidia bacterium]|nr:glucose/galactose MFS transporter [Bacteroidia bacterium]
MVILGVMFFTFGFTSWVNSILVPYFKIGCELNHFQSYLIVFTLYLAYLLMTMPAANILRTLGYKRGIMYGFFTVALGALIFIPAAWLRSYPVFLVGSFVIGAGSAMLQAAANPYVTVIGPIDSTMKRMAIMGICNKFAGLVAPLIFAAVVFKVTDSALFSQLGSPDLNAATRDGMLDALVRRVMAPYGVFAVFLVLVGLLIRFSSLPELNLEQANKASGEDNGGRRSVFGFPYLVLGVAAMFAHIGTQVVTIDTIISYAQTMNMSIIEAKVFPSYTLSLVILGNILGVILIPKIVSQTRVFQICCTLGLLLSVGVVWGNWGVTLLGHQSQASIWFLVGIGLANSLIYGGIWPLAIRGLGRFTKTGSSMLVMALFGNAVVPLIYGWIADNASLRQAYMWILLPGFLYLIFYAFVGHRIIRWK